MKLPYTFTNGTALDADELQATLDVLADGFDQLRNANIVDNAGIDKSKLAQPAAVNHNSFLLVPATSNGSLDTGADANFTLPAALQTKHRTRIRCEDGQLAALCCIDVEVEESVLGGADLPELNILVDGVQFMGQAVTLAAVVSPGNNYLLGNNPPVATPAYPLANNSVIQYQLRRNGAGAPTIRQVSVTETVKREHVAM